MAKAGLIDKCQRCLKADRRANRCQAFTDEALEYIKEELSEAHAEWLKAQQEFGMAAPEFVEAAILKLAAAESRYNTLLRLAKQKGVQDDGEKYMPGLWQKLVQRRRGV